MPARAYYSTGDIAELLGVSRTKSLYIMRELAQREMAFKHGKTYRVRIRVFDKWLEEYEKREVLKCATGNGAKLAIR